jgi:hypothetical protein
MLHLTPAHAAARRCHLGFHGTPSTYAGDTAWVDEHREAPPQRARRREKADRLGGSVDAAPEAKTDRLGGSADAAPEAEAAALDGRADAAPRTETDRLGEAADAAPEAASFRQLGVSEWLCGVCRSLGMQRPTLVCFRVRVVLLMSRRR